MMQPRKSTTIHIDRYTYRAMIAHAREWAPVECIGVLAINSEGNVARYELTNASNATNRFSVDASEQLDLMNRLDDAGLELWAIYHSHTSTEARPSRADLSFARGWPQVTWIIIGLASEPPEVVAFKFDVDERVDVELVVEGVVNAT